MPFGLRNAPAVFCEVIFKVLGDLSFIEAYKDDITVHSKSIEEHIDHIEIVLMRLEEHNLKINLDKCEWLSDKIKVLGHIVSSNRTAMDPVKVKAIIKYPILRQPDPKNKTILYSDASKYAVGAILAQMTEDGVEYVCAYASKLLQGA
jgi:hypothetical protein